MSNKFWAYWPRVTSQSGSGCFLSFYILLTLSHFLGILKNWNRSSIRFWLFLRDIIFSHWFTGAFSSTQTEANSKFDKNLTINNKAAAITSDCCTKKSSEVILKNPAYYRDTIFCCKNTQFFNFLKFFKNFKWSNIFDMEI